MMPKTNPRETLCPRCGHDVVDQMFEEDSFSHYLLCLAVGCTLESPPFATAEEALEWWLKPFTAPLLIKEGNPRETPPVCRHRKGKMIDFNEETFVATLRCRLCGEPISKKASIVCTGDMTEDK